MPIETASLFFVDTAPRPALSALLRSLRDQRLLADTDVEADAHALSHHAALGALFRNGRASLEDFLAALAALTPQAQPQRAFFYVRLAAPAAWPEARRKALVDKLGEQPEAPDAFVHIHPYELVLTLDLADLDGARTATALASHKHRAHPHLPAALRMVDDVGEPIVAASGFEVRCPPETVGVLASALDQAGLLAQRLVLVRVLD